MDMQVDDDVPTVLAVLRSEASPELVPLFYTMEEQWDRKLWHQLTESLTEVYKNPSSQPLRLKLFTQFISTFKKKINQIALVTFGLSAAANTSSSNDALSFLEALHKDVEGTPAAYIYSQIEIARTKLMFQQFEDAKELLDDAHEKLDKLGDSVDIVIKAAYYGVSAEYYKAMADFTTYYRNALQYLSCINLNDLTLTQKQQKAHDLCLAALLGDKIYNFGELLLHPILDSLKDSDYSWLCDFVVALSQGDIKQFDALSVNLAKVPVLKNSSSFLKQKICLTALVEAVFKRPVSSRTLSFEVIAKETHLVPDEVEHLVMKALSLGLVKGMIDQVDGTVAITWLQPRVVNKDQVALMREKLVEWDEEVNDLFFWTKEQGGEMMAEE